MDEAVATRPPLDRETLATLLGGSDLEVEVLAETSSSNRAASEAARAGVSEGHVVVADHQTAGRGRLDRVWQTPRGTAAMSSVVLRPRAEPARWPWLPLLTGLAVRDALAELGIAAGLKWPNDVMIDDRKTCGILVERVETAQGPAAVIGTGINVSMTEPELPVPTATSLLVATGAAPARERVLAAYLRHLMLRYATWHDGDARALREAYAAACTTVGREVRVELPAGASLQGRAVGIDEGGRLEVEHDGQRSAVAAGDVVHVRPRSATS